MPAIITSVARLMPSTSDSRQPYRLSNFDLVTESLTLMAGISRSPFACIWYRRWTPVVVSSVTPRTDASCFEYQLGFSAMRFLMAAKRTRSSSLCGLARTEASFSAFEPRCSSRVASPPSSRIMFVAPPSGHSKMRWVKPQYSSSDSPL